MTVILSEISDVFSIINNVIKEEKCFVSDGKVLEYLLTPNLLKIIDSELFKINFKEKQDSLPHYKKLNEISKEKRQNIKELENRIKMYIKESGLI